MIQLGFPTFAYKIRNGLKTEEIFDVVRRKYVTLTDEEWVRQHCIAYLIHQKKYPITLIAVEKGLSVNGLRKRTDILIYTKDGLPKLIVECKAPLVNITNDVFDQIARYNMTLKVKYLMVTNGIQHFCCSIDHENATYQFLEEVPEYGELMNIL